MRGLALASSSRFTDLTRVVSVNDYGGTPDGVTDNYSAVMRAIDRAIALSSQGYVALWANPGVYKTNQKLDLSGTAGLSYGFALAGVPGQTWISGNIADYLVSNAKGGTPLGPLTIDGISFSNSSSSASAGCVNVVGAIVLDLTRCAFTAKGIGVNLAGAADSTAGIFVSNIEGCRFGGVGSGIAIQSYGNSNIKACDITHWGEGVRGGGGGFDIHGCRFEVNQTGLMLGKDPSGGNLQVSSASVRSNTFEGNDVAVNLYDVISSDVGSLTIQGSSTAPSGMSKTGLLVRNAQNTRIGPATISGSFTDAAVNLQAFSGVMEGVKASNGQSGRPAWSISAATEKAVFLGCDPVLPGNQVASSLDSLALPALSGIDRLNGVKKGFNLRGVNVAVPSGSSSISVAFPISYSSGVAGINTLTPGTGGSLALGTYYYAASIINPLGESSAVEHNTTLTGSNTAVTVAFFGIGTKGYKRRLYRGRAAGVYDGWYDLSLNSDTAFVDTGAAFDGLGGAPTTQNAPSAAEPDASYSITVSPAWDAGGCWITSKATTGFTINFHTAPGSDSTVDWQMIR